jgi:hypothetical protein
MQCSAIQAAGSFFSSVCFAAAVSRVRSGGMFPCAAWCARVPIQSLDREPGIRKARGRSRPPAPAALPKIDWDSRKATENSKAGAYALTGPSQGGPFEMGWARLVALAINAIVEKRGSIGAVPVDWRCAARGLGSLSRRVAGSGAVVAWWPSSGSSRLQVGPLRGYGMAEMPFAAV